ncbi:hypothetical protein NEF87_004307 [Candidatus Lokiarchaeum ossiferum]|uniref:Polysaccharide biosynthesis protein n=1 Tax=Candidatus Lokiarchaeum ossiferum TaxID=2951803 RepID=A0ABY6I0B4_9ARCH|nr:hypothetical protein NEF87_004307 [Candidatus Lokiarchaeum sp. B-35]
MKRKENLINTGLKNTIFVLISQFFSLFFSLIMSFFIPKILGVEQFGYWNIYLFYASYAGIFHLGLLDGIYLRYGHYDYEDLPKEIFRSIFRILLFILLFFTLILFLLILFVLEDVEKKFSLFFAALNVVLGVYNIFVMIFQVTNKFRNYSFLTFLNGFLLFFSVIFLIFIEKINFRTLIIADFSVKLVILAISLYLCRDTVFGKQIPLKQGIKESWINIKVGSILMISNFLGMLLMGLGKIIVERFQSVSEFGLYSFANNSASIVIVFVSAISLVIYPMICRIKIEFLADYFNKLNILSTSIITVLLFSYYPIKWIINNYLIQYIPVLNYLYIIFPIIAFQSKMQILINTYLKRLRKERALLYANLLSVILFCIIGFSFFYFYRRIEVIAWCTFIALGWRCYSSEIYLKRNLNLKRKNENFIVEIGIIFSFIITARFFESPLDFILYLLCALVVFFIKRKTIIEIVKLIIVQIKERK